MAEEPENFEALPWVYLDVRLTPRVMRHIIEFPKLNRVADLKTMVEVINWLDAHEHNRAVCIAETAAWLFELAPLREPGDE